MNIKEMKNEIKQVEDQLTTKRIKVNSDIRSDSKVDLKIKFDLPTFVSIDEAKKFVEQIEHAIETIENFEYQGYDTKNLQKTKIVNMKTNTVYAEGTTEKELIDNWNENSKENLRWTLVGDGKDLYHEDLYNELTSKIFTLECLESRIRLINTFDENQLVLI